ncbi:hypothetical protein SASC598P14_003380, partial [Snodgrassella alvi SCGC AB-598-P14]
IMLIAEKQYLNYLNQFKIKVKENLKMQKIII